MSFRWRGGGFRGESFRWGYSGQESPNAEQEKGGSPKLISENDESLSRSKRKITTVSTEAAVVRGGK